MPYLVQLIIGNYGKNREKKGIFLQKTTFLVNKKTPENEISPAQPYPGMYQRKFIDSGFEML